jgi:hypothetical protein
MADMTAREAADRVFAIMDFVHHSEHFDVEDEDALDMAWGALLDTIPQVLELDEAKQLKPDSVVWIEYFGNVPRVLAVDAFYYPSYWQQYGKNFRWWNIKPDFDQMAATPWDGKQEG